SDFFRIEDIKVKDRPEFLRYKVLSVKPLNGSPINLIKSATIKDNRLNILTNSNTGTGQYQITVRATDRFRAHVDAKFKVKRGAARTATPVTLSSHAPLPKDTLIATVNAPALDGMPATYDFVWKVNGVTQGTATQTTTGTSSFDLSVTAQNADG